MKLEPVYTWILGSVQKAMAKLSRSLTPFHIGTPRDHQGNAPGNVSGVPAGKVAWPVDPTTHDGAAVIGADVFFAYYDAKKREVYMLDDVNGTRHPGAKPLKVGKKVTILTSPKRSGQGVVYRTAEYGTAGLDKNVFQHVNADLIAHHLAPDQPDNSSMVNDPGVGNGNIAGGLHYPLRVREWLRVFCTQMPPDPDNPLYAPLFNLGRNGDGTPAYGAAHWDRAEGTLSDEGGGPLATADDGLHRLGTTGMAEVHQGGLDIDALYGPIRPTTGPRGLYMPEELVNEQWEDGSKGPFVKRVEKRPDFGDKHKNHCGRDAQGKIKWQTWDSLNEYPPPPQTPPPSPPTEPPPEDGPPIDEGPPDGPITGPRPRRGGPITGGGIARAASRLQGEAPRPVTPAMATIPEKVPRASATAPAQLESPSFMGHAEPALPDGPQGPREGTSAHDQAWLNRYNWNEREFIKQPVVADLVAVPNYKSATPNDKAVGADRWEPVLSQEAIYTTDEDGRVTTRSKVATGSGDFVLIPPSVNPKHAFVENKISIDPNADTTGLVILSVNNGTNGIAGWFGLGSRLITGGLASGWKAELDFSSSATEPHINWTKRNASGANAGAGEFRVNGVQVGTGTGDVTGPGSSTSGNLASFNGTTGKVILDSGVAAANVVQSAAAFDAAGNLLMAANTARGVDDMPIAATVASDDVILIGDGDIGISADALTLSATAGVASLSGSTGTNLGSSGTTNTITGTTRMVGADDTIVSEFGSDATDGPWRRTYTKAFTSNGAGTSQTLRDFPVPTDKSVGFRIEVLTKSNGARCTRKVYEVLAVNNAGTVTIPETVIVQDFESGTTYTVVIAVSGTNVRVSATDDSNVHTVSLIAEQTFVG